MTSKKNTSIPPALYFANMSPEQRRTAVKRSNNINSMGAGMDLQNLPREPARKELAKAFIQLRALCGLERFADVSDVIENMTESPWTAERKALAISWSNFVQNEIFIPPFLRHIGEHLDAFFDALETSEKLRRPTGEVEAEAFDDAFEQCKDDLKAAFEEVEQSKNSQEKFTQTLKAIAQAWRDGVKECGLALNKVSDAQADHRAAQSRQDQQNHSRYHIFTSPELRVVVNPKTTTLPAFFTWLRADEAHGHALVEAVQKKYPGKEKAFAELVKEVKCELDGVVAQYPHCVPEQGKSTGGIAVSR